MSGHRHATHHVIGTALVLSALLLIGTAPAGAADEAGVNRLEPRVAAEIDKIFAAYVKPGTPGCALGILRDGAAVYTRGYGWANLEYDIPVGPDTVFEAGSVSKQYAAGAVQILAGEGKLSLDDDVRKYLPEVPDFGRTITIRHLMTHTSGLRDQWGLLTAAGRPAGSVVHTLDEILDLVNRQRDLNFPPGEDYLYCNTNYALLSWIVSRVSGKTMAAFSRERIFEPLGMARTRWRDDFRDVVKGRATAYSPAGPDRYEQNMPFTNVHGNGGLLTTVGDMLIWSENFWNPRVIGRGLLDEMEVPGTLNDGTRLSYALGLFVSKYKGLPQVSHGGATAGYRAYLVRYPGEHVAVAVLSNYSGTDAAALAYKVTEVILAGKLGEPPKPQPIKADPAALGGKAGLYRDMKTDAVLSLAVKDGKIVLGGGGRGQELVPVAPGEFVTEGGVVYSFELSGEGGPLRMRRGSAGEPSAVYTQVAPARPTPEELAAYEGRFWSDELEVVYHVALRDGKLTMRHRPEPAVTLEPTYADGFVAAGRSSGALVRFTRNEAGEVDGLSLYTGRVRHLRFVKQ